MAVCHICDTHPSSAALTTCSLFPSFFVIKFGWLTSSCTCSCARIAFFSPPLRIVFSFARPPTKIEWWTGPLTNLEPRRDWHKMTAVATGCLRAYCNTGLYNGYIFVCLFFNLFRFFIIVGTLVKFSSLIDLSIFLGLFLPALLEHETIQLLLVQILHSLLRAEIIVLTGETK